ncbi:hypothetical protein ASG90_14140 [Nocardioides sp. Soil797]|nr:hypothetical protein ASG90_14140 [Nocardioides sp. Soil797]
MMTRILGALLVVVLTPLAACDDGGTTDAQPADPATTSVHVHFTDSSVPPEYHRSWDLTLDQDTVHLVVDSYGDVIADETVDMPADEWNDFVDGLADAVGDLDDPESGDEGCSGGTSMSLDVDDAGDAETSLEVDNCANDHNEAISDDIESLVKPFTELVQLDKHTRT